MKGKPEVLETLAEMLKEELGAISQYFVHAEMCENWGYKKLSGSIKQQAIGEMKHAEKLIERILFLDGMPNMADLPRLNIGKNVKQQLENDLALENSAVATYNQAVARAQKAGDYASAELLKQLLQDEEEHVDFLESQLGVIKDVGLENYLLGQMGKNEEAE
ncbi:MAG TPA: bacterioferritin [Terriglobia bacterium]|nr:bacterioferritin [Terriglobia bacterium]